MVTDAASTQTVLRALSPPTIANGETTEITGRKNMKWFLGEMILNFLFFLDRVRESRNAKRWVSEKEYFDGEN